MAVAKQRGKGEGSIYVESATGRWRAAVVLPDGFRRRVSARTKKECRARLLALQREMERGGLALGPGRLTVWAFLAHWQLDHAGEGCTVVLALTYAERHGLVLRYAARLAEMPAGARPTAEGRSLTVLQARRLLVAARGDRLEALAVTGLAGRGSIRG